MKSYRVVCIGLGGLLGFVTACQEEEEPLLPTCDELATESLSGIHSDDWPMGLQEAIDSYKVLDATFTATQCATPGDRISIKVDVPDIGMIEIFTEDTSELAVCGCFNDPLYSGFEAYNAIGIVNGEIYIEDHGDPAIEKRLLENVPFVLYRSDSGLEVQGCIRYPLTEEDNTNYIQAAVTVRVADGVPSGHIQLYDGNQASECPLVDFDEVF